MNSAIDISKMREENTLCWECKGKPDFVYFNSESGKILSVVCQGCRDVFEDVVKALGKSFCTDPDCKECEK